MDLQLTGRRALVTGASDGIGACTARLLAAEGVTVAVHGRSGCEVAAVVVSAAATQSMGRQPDNSGFIRTVT